jgi:hypothetical protein
MYLCKAIFGHYEVRTQYREYLIEGLYKVSSLSPDLTHLNRLFAICCNCFPSIGSPWAALQSCQEA